jgi:hypothetical protein
MSLLNAKSSSVTKLGKHGKVNKTNTNPVNSGFLGTNLGKIPRLTP